MTSAQPQEPSHGEILDLAWIEAVGALDPDDRARLAAHLRAGCVQCLDALRGGRDVVNALAHLFAPAAPSPQLGARLRKVAARRAPSLQAAGARAPRRARIASAAAWIALAASVAFLMVTWQQRSRSDSELLRAGEQRTQAEALLAQSEAARGAAERERAELAATFSEIAGAGSRAVSLASEGGAHGRAFVNGERVVLLVENLTAPAADRTYQLWSIEAGVPKSAGTFDTGAAGSALHRAVLAAPVPSDAVLAVTLEPRGGVPQPTGPIVLAQR